jgi:hypothetical protein
MSLSQRTDRFSGIGEILTIKPSSGTPMTLVNSYIVTSRGIAPDAIHATNPIHKPGTTTDLNANSIFFEPDVSIASDGVPTFSQLVIDTSNTGATIAVSQYTEYFTVTEPGVMTTQGFFAEASNKGAAVRTPKANSIPQSRRRIGTVDVSLSTSNSSDTEVAYQNNGVTWATVTMSNFQLDTAEAAANVSASFRTFNNYLASGAGTDSATSSAGITGVYNNTSTSVMTGDTSYTKTGIYRSQTVPFLKKIDGTQTYLKTNVTFA